MAAADVVALGRAALVHDIGVVGVANGIWDRPGPLSAEQWERVRLHPYLTERVLQRSAILAPFAEVAARHHERADGSGYHRGASGDQLALSTRLLAAADAYHAMGEDRPHRPALSPADAATQSARPGRRRPVRAGRGRTPCSRPPGRRNDRRMWPAPWASPSARSTCCG